MNTTKRINIFANVMSPIAVMVVTIVLFFVFSPDDTGTLFWFNMIYTVMLEGILFAYIGWLPLSKSSVILKWMCGTFAIIYICIALVWMLLFGLLLCHWMSLKIYFSVISVISVIWIYVNATTVKVDNISETSKEKLSDNRHKLDYIVSHSDMMSEQFNLIMSVHPELSTAASSVRSLCKGLATLSPTAMADDVITKQVNNIISGFREILDIPISEQSASQIKNYADNALLTLNNIKRSIRR